MASNHWKEIEALFSEALGLPREQRATFLRERCDGRPELHQQVEVLLRNDERAGDAFLKLHASDPILDARLAKPDEDRLINQEVGSYRITKVISRGGMGTVYLAEQANPIREVALKILNSGLWSTLAERRFEHESQVLARLHHPNIAQVYEAATARLHGEDGRSVPYFAMEHVRGAASITDYSDTHRLGSRKRLELLAQVCDAVAHAHLMGIIHRDLKPANILIDEHGHVKVIDFGVARAVDTDVAVTTMHTEVGALLGTLAYMSPEQCAADPLGLDIRSDVYSLGVVLYELLCSKPPYDLAGTAIPHAARTICEQVPVRPSQIDRKLRGDLEIIAMKALEKDRVVALRELENGSG